MSEYITLDKGLGIYKQKGSKNYYLYYRKGRDEHNEAFEYRCSLKTPDEAVARKKAYAYQFAHEEGLKPEIFTRNTNSKLTKITEKLKAKLDEKTKLSERRTPQSKTQSAILTQFLPYFGTKSIEDLDTALMKEIIYGLATNKTKLMNVKNCFKQIFEYAEEKKFIKSYEIPEIPSPDLGLKQKSRIAFIDTDLDKINLGLDSFIAKARRQTEVRNRIMLKFAFRFVLKTGIRPGTELDNIQSKHLRPEGGYYSLKIVGKTSSEEEPRIIPVDYEAFDLIQTLYHSHKNSSIHYDQEDYLFRVNGKKIDWSKVFPQLLKHVGIDKPYTLYSCRHTYITNKLREKVDVYLVARHCGNSVNVIEDYYSALESITRADELIEIRPRKKR